jgi:hypothetical protein
VPTLKAGSGGQSKWSGLDGRLRLIVRPLKGAWRAPFVCAVLVVLALSGGAGSSTADSTPVSCRDPDPTGRQFCVTIEDQDGVSPSGPIGTGKFPVDVTAYQYYKFSIENKGGSTLTNGTLTATLKDHVVSATETKDVNSTASFVPAGSASFCSRTSTDPNTVSCSLPNIAAGPQPLVFFLVYRTSVTPDVKATNLAGVVGFKEGSNGSSGANPATLLVAASTSLEGDPESSLAWSPPSSHVHLGTSPTSDSQFSTLDFNVPPGKSAFLAQESEGAGNLCATGLTCFGEVVTTHLPAEAGTFSSTNLFHLTITINLDSVPGGNTSSIALVHLRDGATSPETIRTRCSSSTPAATELPCITVVKDTKAKVLIIDALGFENGGWHPGL